MDGLQVGFLLIWSQRCWNITHQLRHFLPNLRATFPRVRARPRQHGLWEVREEAGQGAREADGCAGGSSLRGMQAGAGVSAAECMSLASMQIQLLRSCPALRDGTAHACISMHRFRFVHSMSSSPCSCSCKHPCTCTCTCSRTHLHMPTFACTERAKCSRPLEGRL